MSSSNPLTIAFLGCGTLSTAILCGVLSSLESPSPSSSESVTPSKLPSNFVACVQRPASADRIRAAVNPYNANVDVLVGANAEGVRRADVVLLGCKPWMVGSVLQEREVCTALEGKLLISICAGVKLEYLCLLVPPNTRVVRVMPNVASKIREGMAAISAGPSVTDSDNQLVRWMFSSVGKSLVLPEKHMDVCTALVGSGPAFYALMLESMTDGAVMMGVPRPQAQYMAAQVMRGTAELVLTAGLSGADIREQVSTPGGCTIAGLLKLEDGAVRGKIARCMEEATNVAAGLGKK